jgi:hypothetical protein
VTNTAIIGVLLGLVSGRYGGLTADGDAAAVGTRDWVAAFSLHCAPLLVELLPWQAAEKASGLLDLLDTFVDAGGMVRLALGVYTPACVLNHDFLFPPPFPPLPFPFVG